MSELIRNARKLRAIIETTAAAMNDQQASELPEMSKRLRGKGDLVTAGTRINWNGVLKKASVDLWDTPENAPDSAPTLWEDVMYRNGVRVIPEVITATSAFALNELGWWDGTVYKSLRDGNVFNPSVTPEWWKPVEMTE